MIEKAITVDPTSRKAVESTGTDPDYVTVSGQKAGCLEVSYDCDYLDDDYIFDFYLQLSIIL